MKTNLTIKFDVNSLSKAEKINYLVRLSGFINKHHELIEDCLDSAAEDNLDVINIADAEDNFALLEELHKSMSCIFECRRQLDDIKEDLRITTIS